ncbi:indolepyruvate ferredoxin oxidoreductase [Burkholderia cepacia]|uniref:indolepyruvate ferredoxin oxidoreductase family protein n=1 Tax=Burkholderia cepacia TaxID=292 RepID=UPI00075509B2|nr:indolepyruvate ferredoxin oxidoreductase family protein [Burkholderia cepacia]KWC92620.1 indolepyruvate ferredoxin oxidoreductase [Burkholderia cepacia]
MNAPLSPQQQQALDAVTLDDKYTLGKGRVYLSGTQALVRLPMLQRERDRRAGLNTAGFVSGYRGSPLGALDQSLWKAKKHLDAHDVVFQPGVNEDLAATAIWGTQQLNLWPGASVDGVFGMWYGKGPGVDRTGDVFKHANSAGTDARGGVLVLAGDDHAAKSSSVAHQSEHAFIASGIPVLYPSNVQEYLDYGLHGWAMSRYSGLWVAMKCVTDVVESSASVEIDPERVTIVTPDDFEMPPDGLGIRWPDPPLAQEARLVNHKWYAALAYVRANRLNRVVVDAPDARLGIVTAGKAYLDVRQALADLSLDDATCVQIGVRVLKIGCVWPLDAQDVRDFATGLDEILVVEEKRQILEYALKEALYNWREDVRPRIYGKYDERDGDEGGEWSVPRGPVLLPAQYELSPALIAKAVARRVLKIGVSDELRARIEARLAIVDAKEREAATPAPLAERQPWFCSGCPHNTSTRVPEGSRALAGIGCHYMAMWMGRNTDTFSQMGGEGVAWLGQMRFTSEKHVFVNLGDGTYFHSGLLAIRASIAARANITYKVLYNDAVAMTGGQPVDGVLTVPQIAYQVVAEGACKVVVVTDEPPKYDGVALPDGVAVFHRRKLDRIQRELRDTAGTTVLIYDQTCATEKRRRRKRGTYPDPARRAFINDAVCEGCGDCSVQSNCLSVEPLPTPFGTKRKINQSSCNKDFSCVDGFCPSFVTLEGAQLKKPAGAKQAAAPDFAALPEPALPALDRPYGLLVTGIGGTGVVTIGGLLGMAAHLETKGVTVLDMAGLAQKGGAVLSHVQFARHASELHATRIAAGEARAILGCDAIVSASAEVRSKVRRGLTRAVINIGATPTAEFVHDPHWTFPADDARHALRDALGDACSFIDANELAVGLLGDTIYANPLLLGYAWQQGLVPLAYASLMRAIELNGVSIDKNRLAFSWGRYLAHHGPDAAKPFTDGAGPSAPSQAVMLHLPESLEKIVERNAAWLTKWQNARYATRYRDLVARIRDAEAHLPNASGLRLTKAVARNLAKLMAYKDEYEVARLYGDPAYLDKLRSQFEGEPGKDYRITFHLAPPLLAKRDERGQLRKRPFGPWMLPAFRVLARLKVLRGTRFDPFGYTEERRHERALIDEYVAMIDRFCATLDAARIDTAIRLATLPDEIRGFGHVKARNLRAVDAKRARLLDEYDGAAATPAATEVASSLTGSISQ